MSNSPLEQPLLGLGTLVPRVTPLQRQQIRNSHSKQNKTPTGKAIVPTSPTQLLQGWGDPLPPIDELLTLRVVYQNVNGFSHTDPSSQLICHRLQSINCGIFLAAETNVNWRNQREFELFKSWGAKIWPNHRLIAACHDCGSASPHRASVYLPGGAAIWVNEYWSTRVVECGSDPHGLGRWCLVTLGTKGGTLLTIFCAYRVCNQSVATAGVLTATRQQFNSLETQRGKTSSTRLTNPRSQLPKDLTAAIKEKEVAGHLVMLGSDNNETPTEGRHTDGTARQFSMEELFDICNLRDLLTTTMGKVPTSTTKIEGRYIDKITGSGDLVPTAAGILPSLTITHSDHSPLYVDIPSSVLGGQSSPIEQTTARRLSVKNGLIVAKYLTYAISHSAYHKLEKRMDNLISAFTANDRKLTAAAQATYFALDKQYCEIKLAAERQCSRIGVYSNDWSPEYKRAGQLVSYWLYRLKDKSFTGDASTRRLGKKAGLATHEMDCCILPDQCKANLTEARTWLKCLKADTNQHRQNFQETQASLAANGNDKQRLRILSNIKASEKSKKTFRRIAAALGKNRGGLTKLIAPNEAGIEVTMTDKEQIHDRLLTRNFTHYGQANETYFGANGGSAHLIDPDNPTNISDKLLEGSAEFDIQHLSPEAREWLGCLVRNPTEDISVEISEEDYIRHYKSMPEKKSSSPSGLHVGHRIVAARADNGLLRRLDVKIAQLAIWAAAPLPRWGQCILTMLEKPGKGPYLEKLRIIQLVESDLNFVLGLIWGKRLGKKVVLDKSIEATQFATRGKLCNSAALTTCLFNDIHRQTRDPAATAMLDAKACFDRNLPALSIPVSQKFGIPQDAALFLFRTLRAMHFRIRTAHGTSVKSFSAMDNPAEPLQGFGQGAAESPGLHTCTADISNKALTKHHHGALLQHPDRSVPPVMQQKSLFMDDTSLYMNLEAIPARQMKKHGWSKATAAAQALQHLIQTYSQ